MTATAPPVDLAVHASIGDIGAALPLCEQEVGELRRIERLRRFSSLQTWYVVARVAGEPAGMVPVYPTPASYLPREVVTGLFASPVPDVRGGLGLVGTDATSPSFLASTPRVAAPLLRAALDLAGRTGFGHICVPHLDDAQFELVRPHLPGTASVTGSRDEAYFDLPFTSFDDYVGSLGAGTRSNVRRERRLFAESGLTLHAVTPADVVDLEPLLTQVEQTYGVEPSPELQRLYLYSTGAAMGGRGTALVACAGDEPVAFSTLWDLGTHWRTRVWGCDRSHPVIRSAKVYFNLVYYEPIIRAVAAGARRLYAGTGALAAKTERGAKLRRLRTIGWS